MLCEHVPWLMLPFSKGNAYFDIFTEAADLRTSQQWLRTMVWQLSISKGFLSSASPDTSMTFRYPIEIAKDLITVTSRLSQHSMEVHGVGLVSVTDHVKGQLSDSHID